MIGRPLLSVTDDRLCTPRNGPCRAGGGRGHRRAAHLPCTPPPAAAGSDIHHARAPEHGHCAMLGCSRPPRTCSLTYYSHTIFTTTTPSDPPLTPCDEHDPRHQHQRGKHGVRQVDTDRTAARPAHLTTGLTTMGALVSTVGTFSPASVSIFLAPFWSRISRGVPRV